MLNNLIGKNNPGFAYINPAFYAYNGLKLVRGWVKAGIYGSAKLFVFLPKAYPFIYPEATLQGVFFEKYLESDLNKHVYPFRINGDEIRVICGDRRKLQKWSGRFGIAHYISNIVFPWIHNEYRKLTGKRISKFSDILRILRGD